MQYQDRTQVDCMQGIYLICCEICLSLKYFFFWPPMEGDAQVLLQVMHSVITPSSAQES